MNRRKLITGIGALVCAPAIVRAASLMPVRAWGPLTVAITPRGIFGTNADYPEMWRSFEAPEPGRPTLDDSFDDAVEIMRSAPIHRRFATIEDANRALSEKGVRFFAAEVAIPGGQSMQVSFNRAIITRCHIGGEGPYRPLSQGEIAALLAQPKWTPPTTPPAWWTKPGEITP